jgi:hypothetical protein
MMWDDLSSQETNIKKNGHGAWRIGHGVENLIGKFGHDTPTLCAPLFVIFVLTLNL